MNVYFLQTLSIFSIWGFLTFGPCLYNFMPNHVQTGEKNLIFYGINVYETLVTAEEGSSLLLLLNEEYVRSC